MSTNNAQNIIVETSTMEEYFQELVGAAVDVLSAGVSPHAQYYLVHLLSGFTQRQNAMGTETDCLDEPLALMLKRSTEADGHDQAAHLRQLGDVALYVSGFFSDSLNRKLVDIDYYIRMGGSAYAHVARLLSRSSREHPCHPIFNEMSDSFKSLVDILAEVSETHSVERNKDLMRLYEKWVRTRSGRLGKKLAAKGIVPIYVNPTILQ